MATGQQKTEMLASNFHRKFDLFSLKATLQRLDDERRKFVQFQRTVVRKLNYKMSGPYRKHKFFQAIKKVGKLLDRFCGEPGVFGIEMRAFSNGLLLDGRDNLFSPSFGQVEKLCCSIILAADELAKIADLCMTSAKWSAQHLNVAQLARPNLVLLATVSDVWKRVVLFLEKLSQLFDVVTKWKSEFKTAVSMRDGEKNCAAKSEKVVGLKSFASSRLAKILDLGAMRATPTQRKQCFGLLKDVFDTGGMDFIAEENRVDSTDYADGFYVRIGQSAANDNGDIGEAIDRGEYYANSKPTVEAVKMRSLTEVKSLYRELKRKRWADLNLVERDLLKLIKKRWTFIMDLQRKSGQKSAMRDARLRLISDVESLLSTSDLR